jgi:hypothetical protein
VLAKKTSQFSGRLALGTVLFCAVSLSDSAANPTTSPLNGRSHAAESVRLSASRFSVVYPKGLPGRQPALPSEAELEKLTVVLALKDGLLVPLSAHAPGAPTQTITVAEGAGKTRVFRGDALLAVSEVIVGELNRRGIYGVFASVDERDAKTEGRGPGGALRFVVSVAEVGTGKLDRGRRVIGSFAAQRGRAAAEGRSTGVSRPAQPIHRSARGCRGVRRGKARECGCQLCDPREAPFLRLLSDRQHGHGEQRGVALAVRRGIPAFCSPGTTLTRRSNTAFPFIRA